MGNKRGNERGNEQQSELGNELESERKNKRDNGQIGRPPAAAIVLAAGHGTRMHTAVAKQFLLLKDRPLLYYSLKAFTDSGIDRLILVTGADELAYCRTEVVEKYGLVGVDAIVPGGRERYHSVYAGLCALEADFPPDGLVLIHDGARPLVTAEIIARAIDGAARYGSCAAAMPVKDTIRQAGADHVSEKTLDRSCLFQMQTPQAFRYEVIKTAFDRLFSDPANEEGITDDAMVVEKMLGEKTRLIAGSYRNIKVTTPEDMIIAAALLGEQGTPV